MVLADPEGSRGIVLSLQRLGDLLHYTPLLVVQFLGPSSESADSTVTTFDVRIYFG